MKLFLGLIGLFIGAAMNGVMGALFGAALGVGLGVLLAAKGYSITHTNGLLVDPDASLTSIASRLAHLESEVDTLKTEVGCLQAPATVTVPVQASTAAAATETDPTIHAEWGAPPLAPALESEELTFDVDPETPPGIVPLAELEAQALASAQEDPVAQLRAAFLKAAPPQPLPMRPPAPPSLSLKERMPPFLRNWIFGGNTIVKIGVLILFLGLAFLLRYAAERVTVPIELRYAGVALVGAVLLGLGWRLRNRQDAAGGMGFGQILQGAGIGVFYLTSLAALKLNQLLPPELAFGFMFLTAVFSTVLAVAQNAPWLAYVAAAGGFAAPVLVSTGGGNHIALFSYLAILDIGIFLVARYKAWRPLNLIGSTGTFVLASGWAQKYYSDALYPSTQAFLLYFFVLFTAVGVLYARRALAQSDDTDDAQPLAQRAVQALAQIGRVDSALVFGLPLAAFGLQYLLVHPWEFGPAWAALGFSLFYLLLGGSLIRGGHLRYALLGEAYVIVAVIFGTLAIPLALDGSWTGATWAVEAAGMYWLGVRQQRTYTRVFALLVMLGAALRLVAALSLNLTPGTPLLEGSVLNMLMLCASALVLLAVGQRARPDNVAAWERNGITAQLWIALAALTAVAWMVLTPQWASVATALLALACVFANTRLPISTLLGASAVLHASALGGFASTLHAVPDAAMLDSGWQGLVAATLVGLSLLASVGLLLRAALRDAQARQTEPQWSLASSVGLLAGIAVVALSLLFVLPADVAARIWPWLGVAALWLGLRLRHSALALAWVALQLGAGIAFLAFGPPLWATDSTSLTLWTPLGLTLAGLLAGDLVRSAHTTVSSISAMRWIREPAVQWSSVLWSLLWWTQVLLPDGLRYLYQTRADWPLLLTVALAGWVLLSSVLMAAMARWRDWRVLGQTTLATVPAWVVAAALGGALSGFVVPHAHLGWLVWPLALLWHGLLLRMQPRWTSHTVLAALHTTGFWLFLLLAAREAQGWTADLGETGSAWAMLGWALVPAVVLLAITRPRLAKRWPLNAYRDAYLLIACAPVALYLLLWLWASNTQAGAAAPLPYVPLLNPLEIGHGLVLLALFLWRAALPASVQNQLPRTPLLAGLGATALALYTGMVLRICHHGAGVAWNMEALAASTLTQAALSVAWAIAGVALMLVGHKRVQRTVWAVGAALLGVVVLKLFLVELADQGGLYRIVSFIVVGLLLLVVGYFAPVPPSQRKPREISATSEASDAI